jgi:hypothetical protein
MLTYAIVPRRTLIDGHNNGRVSLSVLVTIIE